MEPQRGGGEEQQQEEELPLAAGLWHGMVRGAAQLLPPPWPISGESGKVASRGGGERADRGGSWPQATNARPPSCAGRGDAAPQVPPWAERVSEEGEGPISSDKEAPWAKRVESRPRAVAAFIWGSAK